MKAPTYDDLLRLVESGVAEGLHLDFKDIRSAAQEKLNKLTSEVAAFANSDGGDLIIGVSENENRNGFYLKGQEGGTDLKDSLERAIESNTSPPIVSYVVTTILDNNGSRFYWIRVERSAAAPHQNQSCVYYKRNGSSSKPMEHYEIEDVRARSVAPEYPLDVKVEADRGVFAELVIHNRGSRVIENSHFEFSSDLALRQHATKVLSEKGLKWLYPNDKAMFFLGPIREFLQNENANLEIKFEYTVAGKRHVETRYFDFHDFSYQSIRVDETVDRLKKIETAIVDLSKRMEKVGNSLETISKGFSSSGVHLADSTLKHFRGKPTGNARKYDITDADIEGLRDILGSTQEQAREIWRNFAYTGGRNTWEEFFAGLPIHIQKIITSRFEVPE